MFDAPSANEGIDARSLHGEGQRQAKLRILVATPPEAGAGNFPKLLSEPLIFSPSGGHRTGSKRARTLISRLSMRFRALIRATRSSLTCWSVLPRAFTF